MLKPAGVSGRRLLLGLLLAVATSGDAGLAWGGERVALVVGNGAYRTLPELPNAGRDAALVAERLRSLGFRVRLVRDGDLPALQAALAAFMIEARGQDAAVLYFSGHGVQVDDINYLLPVSAKAERRDDLRREGLNLQGMLAELTAAGPGVGVVMLDACRDNPMPGIVAGAGLGRTQQLQKTGAPRPDGGTGLFIAYATEPGQVAFDGPTGSNGPFAKALDRYLDSPGLDISLLFRRVREHVLVTTAGLQRPWTEETLTKEFQFRPVDAGQQPMAPLRQLNAALAAADPYRRVVELEAVARDPTLKADPAAASLASLADSQAKAARDDLARVPLGVDPLGSRMADWHRVLLLADGPPRELALAAFEVVHADSPLARRARGLKATTGAAVAASLDTDAIVWPLVEKAQRSDLLERFLSLFERSAHAAEAEVMLAKPVQAPGALAEAATPLPPAGPAIPSSIPAPSPPLPAMVAPAPPIVVQGYLGTGPIMLPPLEGEGPFALAQALQAGRLLARTAQGEIVPLGHEPLVATALAYEPASFSTDLVEQVDLVGPGAERPVEYEISVTTHPCDQEAAQRFDRQGITRGRYSNEVDVERAIAACTDAVSQFPEVARLRFELGYAQMLAGRYAEAQANLQAAAVSGHLAAMTALGTIYIEGRGVPRDLAKGVGLIKTAAERGEPGAMNALARAYRDGAGMPKNRQQAIQWFERAMETGQTFAYNNLGSLYVEDKRFDDALKAFEASAQAGDIFGYNNMGQAAERGIGRPASVRDAISWYEKAAEGGQPFAFINLGRLWIAGSPELPADPRRAAYWYARAAENGNVWGHVQLARLYQSDMLGPRDDLTAAKLLARAATARLDSLPRAIRGGVTRTYHEEAQAAARQAFAKLPQVVVVQAVQQGLAERGIDPGGTDGKLTPRTRAAIAGFAKSTKPALPPNAPMIDVLGATMEPVPGAVGGG